MSGPDQAAITDLLARYAVAVDGRDWAGLDGIFTPDATIDYSSTGGPAGDLESTKQFLDQALPMFARTQHMMGLPVIDVHGDEATARTPCHNPMVMDNGDGSRSVMVIGLWYDDECVRTAAGWRIRSRRVDRCYTVTGLTDIPMGPA